MVNTENSYKILIGKPKGKEPVWRPRCRWKDDVEMIIKVIYWDVVDRKMWLMIGSSSRLLCTWQ
jgi:hypothetical protein